ncbi:MAG: FAD-dependent oxidoreductase [Chitinophagaceae bacterium]|nr:FAD-dependent oxidoreductase [Chitinophagaceae bacterium]
MNNKSVIIVGGGVNGLCAAYYLHKEGFDVTVIDRGTIDNNCSFGNMGFLSPSHFVPLASPGIISEGLSYILDSKSPFYIKPRLDFSFIKWGLEFYKNSNKKISEKNSYPLEDLLKLSRRLMDEIREDLGDVFDMETKGCMMMCHSKEAFEKEKKVAEAAANYDLNVLVLDRKQVQEYEPDVELDVEGAVLFLDDAHIHPGKFMQAMKKRLTESGVHFLYNTEVTGFIKEGNTVKSVLTDKGDFSADEIVLSPGSWLEGLTKKLGHKLLIQGGKGYSTTYDYVEKNIKYPAILVDGRCAITPWKHMLRIGGTMEFSGLNDNVLIKRMHGIYDSIKKFYPGLKIDFPERDKIWTGLRPVSPDGLGYIGQLGDIENVHVAGGHAMLGISAGAGTAKLISEILTDKKPEIDLTAFNPMRFS